jgi:hypothetical protein
MTTLMEKKASIESHCEITTMRREIHAFAIYTSCTFFPIAYNHNRRTSLATYTLISKGMRLWNG